MGDVFRMDHHSHPRLALTWVPEGKRKRGRPLDTWRRTVEREVEENGLRTWAAAEAADDDRQREGREPTAILHLKNG